jgi:hypothetical protein
MIAIALIVPLLAFSTPRVTQPVSAVPQHGWS